MRAKILKLTNFAKNTETISPCYRLDNEEQIPAIFLQNNKAMLVRGAGLSYNDCCLNGNNPIIDSARLNHLLSFDEPTGLLITQPAVCFADLFQVDDDYVPAVFPGTLYATVGGAIANDIHGKNNAHSGSFGDHVQWIELQCGEQTIRCSLTDNEELFRATIGGLGLTGIIKRVALQLKRAKASVLVNEEKYETWESLFTRMLEMLHLADYQAAWLDFGNSQRSLLNYAVHSDNPIRANKKRIKVPPLPFRLITPWTMKLFNHFYYQKMTSKNQPQALIDYNNPLDKIGNWNRLYGQRGLLQFQAVFAKENALDNLSNMQTLIKKHQAHPCLTVLKYFDRVGPGLLSFTQPGFTIAIDFVNNSAAVETIKALNHYVTETGGKIYLAKDMFLNAYQFEHQYPNHQRFKKVLQQLSLPLCSDLARRLGICL